MRKLFLIALCGVVMSSVAFFVARETPGSLQTPQELAQPKTYESGTYRYWSTTCDDAEMVAFENVENGTRLRFTSDSTALNTPAVNKHVPAHEKLTFPHGCATIEKGTYRIVGIDTMPHDFRAGIRAVYAPWIYQTADGITLAGLILLCGAGILLIIKICRDCDQAFPITSDEEQYMCEDDNAPTLS